MYRVYLTYLFNVAILCFNNLTDPGTKVCTAPPDLIGIKFPECAINGSLQEPQIKIESCIELSFNGAEQVVVAHNQIWRATGPNVFLRRKGKILLEEILHLS